MDGKYNTFKMTEKRLRRYAILCRRVTECKKEIEALSQMDMESLCQSSSSVVSLIRTGMRKDPEDACRAQLQILKSYVAADEFEIRQIRRALSYIRNDPYYMIVMYKYCKGLTDEQISKHIKCSLSTVRRHRTRLVNTVATALYGMSEKAPTAPSEAII